MQPGGSIAVRTYDANGQPERDSRCQPARQCADRTQPSKPCNEPKSSPHTSEERNAAAEISRLPYTSARLQPILDGVSFTRGTPDLALAPRISRQTFMYKCHSMRDIYTFMYSANTNTTDVTTTNRSTNSRRGSVGAPGPRAQPSPRRPVPDVGCVTCTPEEDGSEADAEPPKNRASSGAGAGGSCSPKRGTTVLAVRTSWMGARAAVWPGGSPMWHPRKASTFRPLSLSSVHQRCFTLAWMGLHLAFAATFSPAALMPVLHADLGLTPATISGAGAAALAASVVTRVVSAVLVRKVGPRYCQVAILLMAAPCMAAMALVTDGPGLTAVSFFLGASLALFVVAQYWVTAVFDSSALSVAAATTASWGNAGAGLPMLVLPLLYSELRQLYGGDTGAAWRATFYFPACLLILFAVVTLAYGQDTATGDLLDPQYTAQHPYITYADVSCRKCTTLGGADVSVRGAMAGRERASTARAAGTGAAAINEPGGAGAAAQQPTGAGPVSVVVSRAQAGRIVAETAGGSASAGPEPGAGAGPVDVADMGRSALCGGAGVVAGRALGAGQQERRDQESEEELEEEAEGEEELASGAVEVVRRPVTTTTTTRASVAAPAAGGNSRPQQQHPPSPHDTQQRPPPYEQLYPPPHPQPYLPQLPQPHPKHQRRSSLLALRRSITHELLSGGHYREEATAGPVFPPAVLATLLQMSPRLRPTMYPDSETPDLNPKVHNAQSLVMGPYPEAARLDSDPLGVQGKEAVQDFAGAVPELAMKEAGGRGYDNDVGQPPPPLPSPQQQQAQQADRDQEAGSSWSGYSGPDSSFCGGSHGSGNASPQQCQYQSQYQQEPSESRRDYMWHEAVHLYMIALRNHRTMLLALSYGASFGAQLVAFNMLPYYLSYKFSLSPVSAGVITAVFAFLNIFTRLTGGLVSGWVSNRLGLGMRGRLWWLWLCQTCGGLFCCLLGRVAGGSLPATVVLSLLFGAGVQQAAGALFAIAPYVSYRCYPSVIGIVSAGGHLVAVVFQLGLFSHFGLSYEKGWMWMGICIMAVSLTLLLLSFPMWGGMLTGPQKPHRSAGVASRPSGERRDDEERYYLAEWTPSEQATDIAHSALSFAKFARAERGLAGARSRLMPLKAASRLARNPPPPPPSALLPP